MLNELKDFFDPIIPPKIFHWKTFLSLSIILWLSSMFVEPDEILRDRLATLSLILLIIGICWRTSQPPFIIYGVPISPWLSSALISLLLYQKMSTTLPEFPLQVWPILSGCLVYIVEFFKDKLNLRPSPPLIRGHFMIVILSHLMISCWIKFYFIVVTDPRLFNDPSILKQVLQ